MHNIECNFFTVHPYTLIREYAKTIIHILYIIISFLQRSALPTFDPGTINREYCDKIEDRIMD